ncbi:hypothetical protein [Kitasatospora sp. NPDC058190]|uniref:hypothetical protein n=1 Tax=Kitasatospora sp. NPDC058190 TaxID=3346371 RepID=UPI0036DB1EAA
MPEYYSSIGEAVGAAMQHNVRLAQRGEGPSEPPLQVRYFPPPAADRYSLPGMVVRLEEDASPQDVAGIIEETTGALVGPLPQLTELVAAAADWARVRVELGSPDHGPVAEVWTQLASAHRMLTLAQEDLETALVRIADCPAEVAENPLGNLLPVLRTRELLHDVMGAVPPPTPDAQRRQAAVASSPTAANIRSTTPERTTTPSAAPAAQPRRTR